MIDKKTRFLYLIKKLKTQYYAYCKKQTMTEIRDHLSFFDIDVNNMTDEDIEQGMIAAGKLISLCGSTITEAAEAFNKLSEASKENNYDR